MAGHSPVFHFCINLHVYTVAPLSPLCLCHLSLQLPGKRGLRGWLRRALSPLLGLTLTRANHMVHLTGTNNLLCDQEADENQLAIDTNKSVLRMYFLHQGKQGRHTFHHFVFCTLQRRLHVMRSYVWSYYNLLLQYLITRYLVSYLYHHKQ